MAPLAHVLEDTQYIVLSRQGRSVSIRADKNGVASASRPSWLRYGVAVLAVGVALLLKLLLGPVLTQHSAFLPLTGAVAVTAWFGGLGPGLFWPQPLRPWLPI